MSARIRPTTPQQKPTIMERKSISSNPVDHKNLAYLIMFYEGVGNLFPWNAFITAAAYFAARFCGTSFQSNFENYFSFAYTFSSTIGLALSIKFQNSMSLRTKVVWPLLLYSISFATSTAFVAINVDPTLLFWVTLLQTCICGLCGATLSGGLFGLGAVFPPAYTGALMNGQGLAGLIVSVSAVVTTIASESTDSCSGNNDIDSTTCDPFAINFGAFAYFVVATLLLFSCVFAFIFLEKLEFTKFHLIQGQMNSESVQRPLLESTDLDHDKDHSANDESENPLIAGQPDFNVQLQSPLELRASTTSSESSELAASLSFESIWKVFRLIFIPAASVMLTFTITIGIFPALTVLMESKDKCKSSERFYNDLFVPFQFLLFNLFDFIGRVAAGSLRPFFTAKNIWIPAVARLVFFPLFLLCNVADSRLPSSFGSSDAFPIIFMALFALSNGYVASVCMMLGPSIVNQSYASLAGTIMIFSLTVGLLFGACTSFLTIFISQGS